MSAESNLHIPASRQMSTSRVASSASLSPQGFKGRCGTAKCAAAEAQHRYSESSKLSCLHLLSNMYLAPDDYRFANFKAYGNFWLCPNMRFGKRRNLSAVEEF